MSTNFVHIIPALLAVTREQLDADFATVSELATAHRTVHIDIADGILVPSTTYPFGEHDVFTEMDCLPHIVREQGVRFSVHCMVSRPERVVPVYIRAGVSEVIVHIESFPTLAQLEACCAMWNVRDVRVVLAKFLSTPVERLLAAMQRTRIHHVLLMSIGAAGRQGSEFDRHVLTHMHELIRQYPSAHITVDGGVNVGTLTDVVTAGASSCVVGSHLLRAKDIQQVYARLVAITEEKNA
jgi:ribulose-phosphate 3-epimerase